MVAELGSTSTLAEPDTIFRTLITVVVRGVDGAELASVATRDRGGFSTVEANDERARQADGRQFELGAGPCVEAIAGKSACHVPDLACDPRWPDFARWAGQQCGLATAFSVAFAEPGADDDGGACLNLYSARVGSFDEESMQMASLLAGYAGIALAAANNALRAANLERALHTNSDIGTAIGVIMTRYSRSHDQAMQLLRSTSQHTNRKVSDLAAEVVRTGSLPSPRSTRGGSRSHRNVIT
jgi:hypothetical protein